MSSVTYCPEDNKLRLYVGRVPRDEYETLRKAGFVSTPKQDCDFTATWTPGREDLAIGYLDDDDDIGDEDYSPTERAADRAERFGEYRDKRRTEATGHADTFDSGPAVFGHQNEQRATRDASRHDKHRTLAVSQWSKAEYWQSRTAGVISNALHRADPGVRRGRVLEIEKLLRRNLSDRWTAHLENRLAYENAMLENEGGKVSEVDIEPGGFICGHQVRAVNRSPLTKRVVSVKLWSHHAWKRGDDGKPLPCLVSFNIERMGADDYRAPTDEERATYATGETERKAVAKAKRKANPKPKLINPTIEDAEKLQAIWNSASRKGADVPIAKMTQAIYSAASKGSYSNAETVEIGEHSKAINKSMYGGRGDGQRTAVFKIRTTSHGIGFYSADRIIVITDKPQKPIPWQAIADAKAAIRSTG